MVAFSSQTKPAEPKKSEPSSLAPARSWSTVAARGNKLAMSAQAAAAAAAANKLKKPTTENSRPASVASTASSAASRSVASSNKANNAPGEKPASRTTSRSSNSSTASASIASRVGMAKDATATTNGSTPSVASASTSTVDSASTQQKWMTDTEISLHAKSSERRHRELRRWVPEQETNTNEPLLSLEETASTTTASTWDQFAVNEKLFGVQSKFDETVYTSTIDKSHPLYKKREKEADRIAREIESSTATNLHIAEERGLRIDDSGLDEEDLYSGVHRSIDVVRSYQRRQTPSAGDKDANASRYRNRPNTGNNAWRSSETSSGKQKALPNDPAIVSHRSTAARMSTSSAVPGPAAHESFTTKGSSILKDALAGKPSDASTSAESAVFEKTDAPAEGTSAAPEAKKPAASTTTEPVAQEAAQDNTEKNAVAHADEEETSEAHPLASKEEAVAPGTADVGAASPKKESLVTRIAELRKNGVPATIPSAPSPTPLSKNQTTRPTTKLNAKAASFKPHTNAPVFSPTGFVVPAASSHIMPKSPIGYPVSPIRKMMPPYFVPPPMVPASAAIAPNATFFTPPASPEDEETVEKGDVSEDFNATKTAQASVAKEASEKPSVCSPTWNNGNVTLQRELAKQAPATAPSTGAPSNASSEAGSQTSKLKTEEVSAGVSPVVENVAVPAVPAGMQPVKPMGPFPAPGMSYMPIGYPFRPYAAGPGAPPQFVRPNGGSPVPPTAAPMPNGVPSPMIGYVAPQLIPQFGMPYPPQPRNGSSAGGMPAGYFVAPPTGVPIIAPYGMNGVPPMYGAYPMNPGMMGYRYQGGNDSRRNNYQQRSPMGYGKKGNHVGKNHSASQTSIPKPGNVPKPVPTRANHTSSNGNSGSSNNNLTPSSTSAPNAPAPSSSAATAAATDGAEQTTLKTNP